MTKTNRIMLLLLGFGLMTSQSKAAVTTFIGEDLQPTSVVTVRTNADAAAASFRTAALALGLVGTINFESAPLGAFTNLTVAPGVTINGTDRTSSPQTILNATNFPNYPSVDGSNTTASGSHFVEMIGGNLTFTFQSPTRFFGVYLTGVQTNFFADSVTFNDGSTQTITLQGTGTANAVGEVAFLGFITTGTPLTSIAISASVPGVGTGFDAIGVDDVSFQTAASATAPEPGSLVLLLPVVGVAGMVIRKRRKK